MEKKVLIVDNNKVILRLLTHFFQDKQYQVLTAGDGLEALRILGYFQPSIVLVDLIMPKINGEKLCRIIRKMPQFESTFIVIVSAIAAENKVDFLSYGADACIAKGPFKEMQENISTVLNYLENSDTEALSENVFGAENIFERDITKELLANKKHFEVTLDNMVDGFLELTVQGNIIFANNAAVELLGVPEEELLTTYLPNLFPAEQKQLIEESFCKLEEGSLEIGDDTPIVLNGKYLLIRLISFFDQEHKFIIVSVQNITKRKQAELELIDYRERLENMVSQRTAEYEEANVQLQDEIVERSKAQYDLECSVKHWRETFDAMNDFVSVQDENMRFVRVNQSLANFLGKTPEELTGKHCYELMHNTHEPLPNCPHVMALKTQEVCTEEIVDPYLKKTFLVTCSPFFDVNGLAVGTVHVARDVTRQKQMEAEREKLITELKDALDEIKTLRGILPVCSYCKNIRDDKGAWSQIEAYISAHSEAKFSHSICPGCLKKHHPEEYESLSLKGKI